MNKRDQLKAALPRRLARHVGDILPAEPQLELAAALYSGATDLRIFCAAIPHGWIQSPRLVKLLKDRAGNSPVATQYPERELAANFRFRNEIVIPKSVHTSVILAQSALALLPPSVLESQRDKLMELPRFSWKFLPSDRVEASWQDTNLALVYGPDGTVVSCETFRVATDSRDHLTSLQAEAEVCYNSQEHPKQVAELEGLYQTAGAAAIALHGQASAALFRNLLAGSNPYS